MTEIDFFGSSKPRTADERTELITRFSPDPIKRADFLTYGFNYWDNPDYGVGYGGYKYDGRYGVCVDRMIEYYDLSSDSKVLEIGCAKGFILNAMNDVRPYIVCGSCETLPWPDDTFDFIYSKETLPHLTESQLRSAISEAIRVCRSDNIFFEIQVSNHERGQKLVKAWDETHLTIHSTTWWREFLSDAGFSGQANFKVLF
jgi:protein-L-isoaspartate(D-aspartate) O-methyltransferase